MFIRLDVVYIVEGRSDETGLSGGYSMSVIFGRLRW